MSIQLGTECGIWLTTELKEVIIDEKNDNDVVLVGVTTGGACLGIGNEGWPRPRRGGIRPFSN